MIHKLKQIYTARNGAPIIHSVDDEIFFLRYFQPCLSCTFCNDHCCSYGVDVELPVYEKIIQIGEHIGLGTAETLKAKFSNEWVDDPDFPGGRMTRTLTNDRGCVFLSTSGRGCSLHAAAQKYGIDYHEIKPMVSSLFPLTFENGVLHSSSEIKNKSLICAGDGATLYEGGTDELNYFFGKEFINELSNIRDLSRSKPILRVIG